MYLPRQNTYLNQANYKVHGNQSIKQNNIYRFFTLVIKIHKSKLIDYELKEQLYY